ncbi:MAG: sigma-54-dependent Fis family transcriptional regulator, partial [Planctomycetota bacterium]|nr:sigma-54-dependent Fis family transcriptional regulator [Planctomycetota bacterium]
NIRELKNVVRASVAVAESDVIDVRDLPPEFVPAVEAGAMPPSGAAAPEQLDDLEREHILRALRENRYNRTRTSQRLGIDRKTLYNKMKSYGLE